MKRYTVSAPRPLQVDELMLPGVIASAMPVTTPEAGSSMMVVPVPQASGSG